mgnify:CR=1 FL=1
MKETVKVLSAESPLFGFSSESLSTGSNTYFVSHDGMEFILEELAFSNEYMFKFYKYFSAGISKSFMTTKDMASKYSMT